MPKHSSLSWRSSNRAPTYLSKQVDKYDVCLQRNFELGKYLSVFTDTYVHVDANKGSMYGGFVCPDKRVLS